MLVKGLVSVVIPSYNHEKYIYETIESIINQTYQEIELIIIDDGSTDNSIRVIESLINKVQNRFVNFTFIKQENSGVCKTINKGLKVSKGEYYVLVSSDDILCPTFIEKHLEFLAFNSEYACSYSDGLNIKTEDIKDGNFENAIKFSDIFDFKEGDLKEHLMENQNYIKVPTISFMYRKKEIEKIGYYDENLMFEDTDMFLRITRNYKIGNIKEVLCLHRLHDYNAGRNLRVIIKGMSQLYDKYIGGNLEISEEFNAFLYNFKLLEYKQQILETKKYEQIIRNRKIVVWGASQGGRDFLKKFPNCPVAFVVDSNINNKIDRYVTLSPEEIKGKNDEYFVFIAVSPKYYSEVYSVLYNYDYRPEVDFC